MRSLFRLTAVAATALAASLNAPTASAVTPAPLTSVVVTGYDATPLAVAMTLTPSGHSSDPSVRLVVVPGTVPTADPNDPAALNVQDVAPTAAAAPVTGLAGGGGYAVSAFAYDAADNPRSYATPATATWTEPSAVTSLTAVGNDFDGGGIVTHYTLPSNADSATTCALEGTSPPTAPATPALCDNGYRYQGVEVVAGHTYSVAVFSWSSKLKGYGPAATTGPITVPDNPPPPVLDSPHSTARDAHSVRLYWGIDSGGEPVRDLDAWVITRATGPTPPPLTASPVAVIPASPTAFGGAYIATGLATDRPYTFTVRARDLGGHLSQPKSRTVAARVSGTYVRDNHGVGNRWRTATLTCGTPSPPDLVMAVTPGGVTHVAYLCGSALTPTIWYTWRSAAGGWSRPVRLSALSGWGRPHGGWGRPFISVSAAGRVVVAWNGRDGRPRWRDRWPGHGWGIQRTVPVVGRLDALVQDNRSHVHLVVGSVYRTNATGSWTQSALPAKNLSSAALTVDPATGRIVVALMYETWVSTPNWHWVASLRIGSKSPSTRSFARLYQRSVGSNYLSLLGVASAGGRVMVAISRGYYSTSGVYLMTGNSVASLGSPRRVPYTGRYDVGLTLSMPSPTLAVLSWVRNDPSWAATKIGLFTSDRRYSSSTGTWVTSTPVQRSRSWYDQTSGAYRDRAGHLYIAFTRVADVP